MVFASGLHLQQKDYTYLLFCNVFASGCVCMFVVCLYKSNITPSYYLQCVLVCLL